ncbi:hypothetical protein R3I94_012622 [Phoxinus phoxinus]|uniref:Uncharacterized protein n=1 Tax=Phoxinus phoxinus TaxID=58324 RepID=A0AAN9CSY7_9TELE
MDVSEWPEKLYTAVVRLLSAFMSAGTASKPCCKTSIYLDPDVLCFQPSLSASGGKRAVLARRDRQMKENQWRQRVMKQGGKRRR